jgi:hypothetical protein
MVESAAAPTKRDLSGSAATTAAGGVRYDDPAPQGPSQNLKAGNIDDNADFSGFLTYLQRIGQEGVPFRPLDPSGRIIVTVTDANQHAASGVEVTVKQGDAEIARLRTTADGTIRFHPRTAGQDPSPSAGSRRRRSTPTASAVVAAPSTPTMP